MKYLIVGLGNPGKRYEKTRHNLGFMVLRGLAEKYGLNFRTAQHVHGELAVGEVKGKSLLLLMPMTYMNLSGQAVKEAVMYYKVDLSHLLILSDDINLEFGTLRLRQEGSSGGHNGLKSIESSLQTQHYARLRVGIDDRLNGDLADYVLDRFSEQELEQLSPIIEKGIAMIETWLGDLHETNKTPAL